jgi:hypothetical protein
MSRGLRIFASIVAAILVFAAMAHAAEGPTQEEYTAQVEPICEQNTLANRRILAGARFKANHGKRPAAGRQFIRAATAFGATTKAIEAVSRPPAYEARLTRWIERLRVVESNLRKMGKALKADDLRRAILGEVKLRSSALAANNVVYDFDFRYCRLSASRFD